jgi:NtrC-family two-component system sensor histidine kinase KinB
MLRLRLFYGLLTIILLLWSVGAAALLLMRDSSRRFDKELRENYRVIACAQDIRTLTATINATYLPTLAGAPPEIPPDRALFDRFQADLKMRQGFIHKFANKDPRWRGVIARFDPVVASYVSCYETFFDGAAVTRIQRGELLQYASSQTLRLTDLTENMITLGEEKIFSAPGGMTDSTGKNVLFVSTLVLLGTGVAGLIYTQLIHHLVDPVTTLERSIDEIRCGNFELTLSQPRPGSEFSKVIAAFNDMALELKIRRGESDENLRRANLVNGAILEAIPSPVFVLDEDAAIIQINPAAEALTECLGVGGRLPMKIQSILDVCRENSTHFLPEDPREALLFRIEEKEHFYLPRIFRYESETSGHSGWSVLLHNVSRIRWLDDMKTNLISTVSHEIKTPLTGIRMVLHLLLEDRSANLDEMQRVMVSSATEDCERLLATLNNLLDLSRAESGTTHLDRHPMTVDQSVQRVTRGHTGIAARKAVSIRLVPPESPVPEILADPVRLDEVLNNLVSNAIKYSPHGGEITLSVTQPDADFVRVSVTDEGAGVPTESQSRIFERFYRAPGQAVDGVGLGLFISREIIRAHEGRIGLCERRKDRTEFFIDVPIA